MNVAQIQIPENVIEHTKMCRLSWCSPDKESYWFGYYNYSPISSDGSKMLAHHVNFEGRMPQPNDRVEIGYFNLAEGKWNKLASSAAFNWQQGSMLQWLGPDFNTRIIYNDMEDSHYIAKIISIESQKIKTIPYAIYSIDPSGNFSITLNFERCYWTRAYSYATVQNDFWNRRIPRNDGIFKIDLISGEKTKIISLENFVNTNGGKDDGVSAYWFEHIQMNPSGTRFAFYHRFGINENFTTHVYTADCSGGARWHHPMQLNDRLSHLGWRNEQEYVIFTHVFGGDSTKTKTTYSSHIVEKENAFARSIVWMYRKLLKPAVVKHNSITKRNKQYYMLTTDQKGLQKRWGGGILSRNGHPSFTKDGRFMLTDTYADDKGFRHLILFDSIRKKIIPLAKLYSTFNNCGWRADLHPRFSPDENKVIVDSTHNGYHQIVVFELDWNRIGL